ncbi:MAG: hypothetical protein K8S23_07080 [Candidatus Cloacimonetes bacterium]|nr:hypothetical protein [Candidatus Cloacimonadota bacterium]
MTKYLIFFSIILFSITLFGSDYMTQRIINYAKDCNLIVQGELTQINKYIGNITEQNVLSIRDTAYIKIRKIYRNNSNVNYCIQDSVKFLMPPIPSADMSMDVIRFSSSLSDGYPSEKIGQTEIWLFQEKEGYATFHPWALQPISKEKIIQEICKTKPEVIQFLFDIFMQKNSEVRRFLATTDMKSTDNIFKFDWMNPIFLAINYRNKLFITDFGVRII